MIGKYSLIKKESNMKKFWLTFTMLMCMFLVTSADALTWHTANQATVGWDPVLSLTDGTLLPSGTVVEYEVFSAILVDKSDMVSMGRTADYTKAITLTREGGNFIGVKAIRVEGSADVSESTISWSDNSAVCANGEDFGIQFYLIPAFPMGIYKQ